MLHALPALGADRRIFPNPWDTLPGFVAHDWPPYRGERSLAEVARRVAELYAIQDGDSVIGSSLGGMIGCEIAKIRQLHALYLVASATSTDEINRGLSFLHPMAAFFPFNFLQFAARGIPWIWTQMFASVDSSFVRAMCFAIFRWEGLGSVPVRCFRIHGRRDLVISPPPTADLFVDGGHLIAVTQAQAGADFVRKQLVKWE